MGTSVESKQELNKVLKMPVGSPGSGFAGRVAQVAGSATDCVTDLVILLVSVEAMLVVNRLACVIVIVGTTLVLSLVVVVILLTSASCPSFDRTAEVPCHCAQWSRYPYCALHCRGPCGRWIQQSRCPVRHG